MAATKPVKRKAKRKPHKALELLPRSPSKPRPSSSPNISTMGYTAFHAAQSTDGSPPVRRRGRPIGWRKAFHGNPKAMARTDTAEQAKTLREKRAPDHRLGKKQEKRSVVQSLRESVDFPKLYEDLNCGLEASRLRLEKRLEEIFEIYERDFVCEGDETHFNAVELVLDNGYARSAKRGDNMADDAEEGYASFAEGLGETGLARRGESRARGKREVRSRVENHSRTDGQPERDTCSHVVPYSLRSQGQGSMAEVDECV